MNDQSETQQSDPAQTTTNVSGGVNAKGPIEVVDGDIVGRDKIISVKAGAAVVVAALIIGGAIVAPQIIDRIPGPPSLTPSPTPACISADDVIVTFHILKGTGEIATLSSGESALLDPGLTVDLQAEIRPVADRVLPPLECTWTNTGIAADGSLLHNSGCRIDYRSGRSVDAVSLQLTQPSCPAFAPYPFFITPKP